jgi:MFS transporter, DHA1 family, multidrug resistance protein
VLGACMFGGGILVSPLMALSGEGTAITMAAVVAGGAVAALLATVVLTRGDHPEPDVDVDADVSAQPIEE